MDDNFVLTGECCLTIGKVSIYPDGRIMIHEGANLDEVAISFWEDVQRAWPGFLNQPNKHTAPVYCEHNISPKEACQKCHIASTQNPSLTAQGVPEYPQIPTKT